MSQPHHQGSVISHYPHDNTCTVTNNSQSYTDNLSIVADGACALSSFFYAIVVQALAFTKSLVYFLLAFFFFFFFLWTLKLGYNVAQSMKNSNGPDYPLLRSASGAMTNTKIVYAPGAQHFLQECTSARRRLKAACASTHYKQNLYCPSNESVVLAFHRPGSKDWSLPGRHAYGVPLGSKVRRGEKIISVGLITILVPLTYSQRLSVFTPFGLGEARIYKEIWHFDNFIAWVLLICICMVKIIKIFNKSCIHFYKLITDGRTSYIEFYKLITDTP